MINFLRYTLYITETEKAIKTFIKKNNIEVMLNNLDYTVFTDIKCILYILDQIINNAIKTIKNGNKGYKFCLCYIA